MVDGTDLIICAVLTLNMTLTCVVLSYTYIIKTIFSLGLNLELYDSNVVDYFVSDAAFLLKISSSETCLIEQMVIACAVLTFVMTLDMNEVVQQYEFDIHLQKVVTIVAGA
ncbi:Olfactory receptor 6C68 [Camelus dromedarius]|uniref:Olfactory receptor 6C68 n=1 Tax=Camelus dromedarius TaxID=9838 RepID=A0A5N4C9M5_CAMDR|nr:Olfactory receptor 6C68 [Camelus dromedarius]